MSDALIDGKENQFAGCLLKVGQYQHITSFISHGLLYCNSVQYFADVERADHRGDPFENVIQTEWQPDATVHLSPVDSEDSNAWKKMNVTTLDCKRK